ncbi:MAG: IS110 family transposase [Massilia sp.]
MEYVGIDIAKRKFDLLWVSSSTNKRRSKVFDNSPSGFREMFTWLAKHALVPGNAHLAMEATSQYYEKLAEALFDAGFTVSVVNPLQVKRFGEALMIRQKTDKADADLIARFCAQCEPRPWAPPPLHVRELQRLVARLDAVQDMLVQEQNRRYVSQGVTLESVERMIASLDDEQKLVKSMIKDHIDRHPDLHDQQELLCSIPGVAERLSAYFMAWLPVDRFDNVREAVAFIGLSPRHRESGDSIRGKSRLCKQGHARLRKMLYMPAMAAIRCNAAAQAMAKRLRENGKRGKIVIAAVMRKLVHWMIGVLKAGAKFDPNLALAKA